MREWNATPGDRALGPGWEAAPQVTTYAYDGQSRLRHVDYPDGRHAAFSYDLAGNRLTETETDGSGRMVKDRRFACDASNRLRTVRDALVPERSVRYAYNRRGDVTGKTVARLDELGQVVPGTETLKLSFLWDAPGRLRKVLKAGASGTETAAEFRYDYAGRRVSKEARSLLLPGSAPDVRLYAPDEAAFLCEFRPAAGGSLEKVRQHVYGDELLCTEERGTPPGARERRYFSGDALGSTVALTGDDGAVAEAYLYDAWGNYRRADVAGTPLGPLGYDPSTDGPFGPWNGLSYLAQTQSAFAADPNRLTFTGHEFDPETGLYYAQARFYDPEIGRFASEDSFLGKTGEPPSLHRYLYANCNPLYFVDWSGFLSEESRKGRYTIWVFDERDNIRDYPDIVNGLRPYYDTEDYRLNISSDQEAWSDLVFGQIDKERFSYEKIISENKDVLRQASFPLDRPLRIAVPNVCAFSELGLREHGKFLDRKGQSPLYRVAKDIDNHYFSSAGVSNLGKFGLTDVLPNASAPFLPVYLPKVALAYFAYQTFESVRTFRENPSWIGLFSMELNVLGTYLSARQVFGSFKPTPARQVLQEAETNSVIDIPPKGTDIPSSGGYKPDFIRVGEGVAEWTAPNGRVFADATSYVRYMRHRHMSMLAASRGRAAHLASEIEEAGFIPSNAKLTEGTRSFIPEAIQDQVGNPHFYELKTSGYYSKSFENNIYPSAIYSGRRGIPFTLELQGTAKISQPLRRFLLILQKRFGGEIRE